MTVTTTPALTLAGGGISYGNPVLTIHDRDCDVDAVFSSFTVSGLPSKRWRLVLLIDSIPAIGKGPAQQIISDTGTAATSVTLTQSIAYVRIKDIESMVAGTVNFRLSLEWLSGTAWVPVAESKTSVNYSVPPAAQTNLVLGANIHPFSAQMPAEFWRPALDAAQAAGFNWIRFSMPWGYLETGGKGVRDANMLSILDTVMADCESRGLKVLLIASGTAPGWSSTKANTAWTYKPTAWLGSPGYAAVFPSWSASGTYVSGALPPDNWQDYTDHITWIVNRYANATGLAAGAGGTVLGAVECMNEPYAATAQTRDGVGNPAGAMANTPVSTLAAWQQHLYSGVKAANANVTVIGMVSAYNDWVLLQNLYNTGTFKGNYDVISVHPYPVQFKGGGGRCYDPRIPFGDTNAEWHHHPASLGYLIDVMNNNNDPAGIWVTEFGQSVGNTAASNMNVSLAEQADHIAYMWKLICRYQRVRGIFIHSVEDRGNNYNSQSNITWNNFGIVATDHVTRRPAFYSVQNVLTKIKNGTA